MPETLFPKIRLSIFSRLTIVYLSLFIVIGGIAVYAVYKLHQINRLIRITLNTNSPVLEHKAHLVDSILSQLRFKKNISSSGTPSSFSNIHPLKEILTDSFPSSPRQPIRMKKETS